jgi:hypothetical protein
LILLDNDLVLPPKSLNCTPINSNVSNITAVNSRAVNLTKIFLNSSKENVQKPAKVGKPKPKYNYSSEYGRSVLVDVRINYFLKKKRNLSF